MPILPEQIKPQNGRIRTRSLNQTEKETKDDLLGLNISSSSSSANSSLRDQKAGLDKKEVDVGFKMNIFLSGLSNSEQENNKINQAVLWVVDQTQMKFLVSLQCVVMFLYKYKQCCHVEVVSLQFLQAVQ